MSIVNEAVEAAAATVIETKSVDITYHFKPYDASKDGHQKLVALLDAGKLGEDDIDVIPAKDDMPEKLKRKSVIVNTQIPVVVIDGFTPEQNAHVEYLIAKQVEDKNKKGIDSCTGEWVQWDTVLQLPPLQRAAAAVKVSSKMVIAVTDVLEAALVEIGLPAPAIELTKTLALKKFSVAACNGVNTPVIEKISTIINTWYEGCDDEVAELVAPVVSVWTTNINTILNPAEQAVTEDMFAI